jgi:hypothetical protein
VGFLGSRALGDKAESYIANILKGIGCDVEFNKTVEYDLKCKLGRKKFTGEVKFDYMAQKTGNIALEYYNPKQDKCSGISQTSADLWFTVLLDDGNMVAWAAKTSDIRSLIENKQPVKDIVGGDGNSAMKIYKQEDIFNISYRFDDFLLVDTAKKILKGLLK